MRLSLLLQGRDSQILQRTMKKISLSKRGIKFSDEHRKKLSEAKKGKTWSADRRAAMKQPSSVELSVDVV